MGEVGVALLRTKEPASFLGSKSKKAQLESQFSWGKLGALVKTKEPASVRGKK
jgi:hypothetical protein